MLEDIIKDKFKKLEIYRKKANPYPARVKRTAEIGDVLGSFSRFEKSQKPIYIVGRIMSLRDQGRIIFVDVRDESGSIQAVLKNDETKRFDLLKETLDLGDFIQVGGEAFKTKTGAKSVSAKDVQIIAKSLRPWPSSWFGLEDTEERHRRRYLDFMFNNESKEKIITRSNIINIIRNILSDSGFMEVETPILQPLPGGAMAAPFKTHFNALNLDVYLRIAPELYLKRLLVGGFEKIFELGRDFRNEGIDRDHYPEFTMLELYWAYQDYNGLMDATESWLKDLVKKLEINKVTFRGKNINMKKKWPRVSFKDLIKEYSPSNVKNINNPEIDDVFKKQVRPKIIDPIFVINHPKAISPLSKPMEEDPDFVERFQLVAGGTELVNGFSELNDPVDQRERMELQEKMHRAGNEEASRLDEDFLEAVEFGMPPAAGLGLGIDRLVAFLADTHSVRDVMTFTTLKPKKS